VHCNVRSLRDVDVRINIEVRTGVYRQWLTRASNCEQYDRASDRASSTEQYRPSNIDRATSTEHESRWTWVTNVSVDGGRAHNWASPAGSPRPPVEHMVRQAVVRLFFAGTGVEVEL